MDGWLGEYLKPIRDDVAIDKHNEVAIVNREVFAKKFVPL